MLLWAESAGLASQPSWGVLDVPRSYPSQSSRGEDREQDGKRWGALGKKSAVQK